MSWNTLSDEGRLHLWRALRTDIASLPAAEQIARIAKFCSALPVGRRTVDYYSPDNWPTPWEIMFYGEFCRSSISLIIFYTLLLLNKEQDIELWVVKDNNGDYLLPIINGEIILNYEAGTISKYSEICDYFIVMQKFSKEQIKTIT